ncbi:hypothetical protein [Vulgatibacter incomptus]|nr:hypothetical protein [Vulgatibacter incomptus]
MPFFLRTSIGFYLLATALGLVLRIFFVAPFGHLVFANALHAHSHTLYFGWGALGIFALAFRRLGAEGRASKAVLGAIAAIAAATFVSFLLSGYSPPSIAISSLSLGVWGWAAATIWRRSRGSTDLDVSFLRAGIVYLVLASLGALTRVALIALQAPTFYKSLAVFAFLHDFAWFFVLSVVGLLIERARAHGLHLDERLLRWQLRLSVPLAWLTFPLGVAGGANGLLGTIASVAAIALVVPAGLGATALWRAGASAPRGGLGAAFRWLAIWLALEAVLSAAGGLGLAGLAVHSRHLAILYLHVLLLGFVTLGLMVSTLSVLGGPLSAGSWLHNGGLSIMALGLAAAGLPAFGLELAPLVPRLGLIVAAFGGAVVIAGGIAWSVGAWRSAAKGEERASLALHGPL